MRKSRGKVNRRRLILVVIAIFSVFTFSSLKVIQGRIEPKVRELCTYYCKAQLSRMLSESVEEVITENDLVYSDFVQKHINNGSIEAVEMKMENLNKVQSMIVLKATEKLEKISKNNISVPIGSVSNFYFLSGRGPEIKIRFLPEGDITAKLSSGFSSAGINQTCHTVSVDITAEAVAVLPTENISINVETSCIVAESIIIGDVPGIIPGGYNLAS
ncbi:MAG: sporulation protein YunB [Porcipelethomonas sp.]